jgi:long-chain acyl-CoA synthetase
MLIAGSQLNAQELHAFLADRLANFKIPALTFFQYEQLPRIASGKIAKKELRQQTIDSLASAVS